MRWVTRSGPHVDRMASAWLIRRFIDPQAEFCFTNDPDDLPAGATPFDMRGVELSHQGENCTFETLLKRYELTGPALDDIAELVHEADIGDDRYLAPAATGLDLVTRAISLVCDDEEAVRVGMIVFEGLYQHTRQKLLRRPAGP